MPAGKRVARVTGGGAGRGEAVAPVQQRQGCVINFSSTLSHRPRAATIASPASRGAVDASPRTPAIEAAAHGVGVNCIAPALVRSQMDVAAGMAPSDHDHRVPDKASWLTGQIFAVDGRGMLR